MGGAPENLPFFYKRKHGDTTDTSDTSDTTDTTDTNLIGNTLDCCSKEGDGETEFDPFQRPILPKTKVVDTCRKAHPKW